MRSVRTPLCSSFRVSTSDRAQLGRVVVTPFATIGVLAAVLVWEVEHVGSILMAIAITAVAVAIGVMVARRLRRNIAQVEDHYAVLLRTADEQSQQAETANRLKDDFLAILSHELRTPLNSVLGWARLLASGKLDDDQATHAVQAIERAGWAQSRLIEDLLDVSRIVAGTMNLTIRPAAVRPIVGDAVDSLRPAAEARRIVLNVAVDPSLPTIAVDPDRLKQIVWNLVSNAIKFTPFGGCVDVGVTVSGGEMRLTVRDTGIGFRPDVAAHLFERFRQGDASSTREHGGLGLGLGIVRHLAELHGGSVTAVSGGEGEGSTFGVRLPIRILDVPEMVPANAVAPAPSLRGVTVLAVDDDPHALDFVRDTLERHGAIVVTASSPAEAKARFKRDPPDVLVSDMVLPGEDGLSLIRAIRQLDPASGGTTPAAALTALARTEDRRRALSAGFHVHVAKPVEASELVSTVEWLARRN
jgi:signal transduction histidine kinase/CheY-like chemotaxis protein